MSAPPFTVRLSPALRSIVREVAGAEDQAEAIRALLILGAERAGLDLATLEPDIAAVLARRLAPDVRVALKKLYAQADTTRIQSEYNPSNGRLEPMDDPFGSIGIEV